MFFSTPPQAGEYASFIPNLSMSSPLMNHWVAVEKILCYLKGAPRRGILHKNHVHTIIDCFSDVVWAESRKDRRSTHDIMSSFAEIWTLGRVRSKMLSRSLV